MSAARRIEHTVEAYLSNEDSPSIGNPIHSTEVAAQYGFAGALVGGVTVWGWATPAILEALGDAWLAHGWAEFSFRQPTYPGDGLTILVAPDAEVNAAWSVVMRNQDGIECVRGSVGLGDAAWAGELVTPERMQAAPAPDSKPALTLDRAPVGEDWAPLLEATSVESARAFALEQQRSEDPRFVGDAPVLHPAWTAGWAERLLRHNFAIPSSMHTRSYVQQLRPIEAGAVVTGGARLLAVYERHAHHFANFDVLLRDSEGSALARLRHWTVFRIATPEERARAGSS